MTQSEENDYDAFAAAYAADNESNAWNAHYERPTLREFHRVLVPGGRLVISTHHPFMDHQLAGGADYFATYDFGETWRRGGREVQMRFWHRPLGAMIGALAGAGFTLDAVEEPPPSPVVRELDPRAWHSLTTQPRYIFFAARR